MIAELKEAADKWFGDNGNDDQEEAFILGFMGAIYFGAYNADYEAGEMHGEKYRDD